MMKYLQKMKDLTFILKYFEIFHIPRIENIQADALLQLATTYFNSLDLTFVECLEQPNIDKVEEMLQINNESSWMDPIIQYLTDATLLTDP